MTEKPPALWTRMRAMADKREREAGGHPDQYVAEMREKADAVEVAATGYWSDPQTHTVQQMLGAYARAKLFLRDVAGEPLI